MARRLQHAGRRCVAHREHAGWSEASLPGTEECRLAALEGRRRNDDPLWTEFEPDLQQGLAVTAHPAAHDTGLIGLRLGWRHGDDQQIAMVTVEQGACGGKCRPR